MNGLPKKTQAWAESLPSGWSTAPLWAVATCNDDSLPESTDHESQIRYIEISDVNEVQGIVSSEDISFGNAPSRARRKVREGDVILSTVRTYLRAVAAVGSDHAGSVVSTGFAVIRPQALHPGYLKYVVASDLFIEEVIARSVGVSYPAINATEVMKLKVPVPPLKEQCRIAAFLDHETARIDELVREHTNLIHFLSEKRQSIVLRAITQGLEGHPANTSSGVEWLGYVPSHWRVTRLRHLITRIEQGWSPEAENRPPTLDEWGVLKLSAVSDGRFHEAEAKALPASLTPRLNLEIRQGDFLITRANTPSLVGGVCVVAASRPRLMLSDLIYRVRLMRNVLDGEFLAYYLSHPLGRIQIESDARGTSASMVKVSQEHIRNWLIPVPPIEEQRTIVDHLNRETRRIDLLMLEAEQAIALAHERRSALISAGMTGQLDLRDWQAPEPETVAEVA